ncbi:MAG: sugar phosphate isomerase/epimerase family protein [Phycisphaerae bacterium]|nr:sugar phosphate isomerase/epimerase family protein [Phycisphaerae bacterium]
MKRISIGTWAYSIGPYADNPVPFDEVVRRLSDLGFDGLELGGFSPHPNPDDLKTAEERAAVKELVTGAGLGFSGLAADLWTQQLINTDDNTEYLACFRKNLKFCQDLGIETIRVDTVQPPTVFEEVDPDTALDRVVVTWKRCAEEAADAGIRLVWEFEPGFAFNKPSDILRILDEVNHPNFSIMYDTCHAYMVAVVGARQPEPRETLDGGALELARKLHGKIGHIHLIDSDGTLHDDETSTHAPFGEGLVDFDELMPELIQSGVPHDWWTIDLCFWADAWAVTEQCKKAVDDLNRKYG